MKPTFAKLGLKLNNNFKTVMINDQEVEVKQYLSIQDKLQIISNVINLAADDNNFNNPIKLQVFLKLETIFNYTNLSFTEKQKEDMVKLYDLLESNQIFEKIIEHIPESEYVMLQNGVIECADNLYKYRNSALGIMESISSDYSDLNFDATAIQEKLADEKNLELLRSILTKMG